MVTACDPHTSGYCNMPDISAIDKTCFILSDRLHTLPCVIPFEPLPAVFMVCGPTERLLDFTNRGLWREASLEQVIDARYDPVPGPTLRDDQHVAAVESSELLKVLEAGSTWEEGGM